MKTTKEILIYEILTRSLFLFQIGFCDLEFVFVCLYKYVDALNCGNRKILYKQDCCFEARLQGLHIFLTSNI